MDEEPSAGGETDSRPKGMKGFTIVWAGQLVSLLGTGMTSFAIVFWAWQMTGSATVLAVMAVFAFAPGVIFVPFAGAMVDRWDRKLVLIMVDSVAAIATTVILVLYVTGILEVWHLFVVAAVESVFGSFQFPAFSASITMMISKKHLARASGMLSLANSVSGIFAPPIAAAMLVTVGIANIFIIDILTFFVAIATLAIVHIPRPAVTEEDKEEKRSVWKDAAFGFRFMLKRRSLLGLQLLYFAFNMIFSFSFVLFSAMILARTSNDALLLGSVAAFSAVGSVAGSLLLIAWGGPKQKVRGVIASVMLSSLLGTFLLGLGREFVVWATASFLASFFVPIAMGCSQAIWQTKVPPDQQGRVFAARGFIARVSVPIAYLMAGPLADYVFEPGMKAGGGLADIFGPLVGTGPGAGMALMFIISGILGTLISLAAFSFRNIRNLETVLPDYDAKVAEEKE